MSKIDYKIIDKIKKSVFVFKKGTEFIGINKDGNVVSIPTQTSFMRFVHKNYDPFSIDIEEDDKKKFLAALFEDIRLENQYEFFEYIRDPFSTESYIQNKDHTLAYYSPGIFIAPLVVSVDKKIEEKIVANYLQHFPQFDELIEWVIACRFNEARRNSFTYMRVNAGFGKSFFMSLFKDLGFAVEIKNKNLENTNASEVSPVSFRNAFILLIDEWTHFSQASKDITHMLSLAPKFGMKENVPVYAKIFMSAEKSTSFFGDAGVDRQLSERCSLLDIESVQLDTITLYAENTVLYADALKQYIHRRVSDLVKKYITIGRENASKEARKKMNEWQAKFYIEGNTEEKIREKIIEVIEDFLNYKQDGSNRKLEELKEHIYVYNSNTVAIKSPVLAYEKIIKMQGEQFSKVAKFKQTALDTIFKSEYKVCHIPILNTKAKCYLFRYKEPDPIPAEVVYPNGDIDLYDTKTGKKIF